MSLIQPTRRGLIGALIAGPAIVRVASIMPVRALLPEDPEGIETFSQDGRIYVRFRFKGQDGIVRTSFMEVL